MVVCEEAEEGALGVEVVGGGVEVETGSVGVVEETSLVVVDQKQLAGLRHISI